MWPFADEKKKYEYVLEPLRKCSCGVMSYARLRADDAVYCTNCGAMYLFVHVMNPVVHRVKKLIIDT